MCGIAGAIFTGRYAGKTRMEAVLPSMLRSLEHRGPDDRGESVVYSGDRGKAGFVHTRLAILDLSAAGHQPMREPGTGNVITFNGEIYNFRQVRARLDAAGSGDWASTSDTEVILKAYGRWEEGALEELRGMFAFAIWDASREELFLARDRVGIKPLYYYSGEGCFLFASEVRALLATGLVPRKIDEVGLWEYLGYQAVPAPRTLIDGVRMLRPGHWMRVDMAGQITEARYWDALENARSEGAGADESRVRARVGELLRESVSMHLVSDVPVAAFLSGGIDSSAVAVLMREA
ncbi:MAG: asparagine synthase (glutamine-hydrolyzing), partial [Blastocatellia bacterium]